MIEKTHQFNRHRKGRSFIVFGQYQEGLLPALHQNLGLLEILAVGFFSLPFAFGLLFFIQRCGRLHLLGAAQETLDLTQIITAFAPSQKIPVLTGACTQGDHFAQSVKKKIGIGGIMHIGFHHKRITPTL